MERGGKEWKGRGEGGRRRGERVTRVYREGKRITRGREVAGMLACMNQSGQRKGR